MSCFVFAAAAAFALVGTGAWSTIVGEFPVGRTSVPPKMLPMYIIALAVAVQVCVKRLNNIDDPPADLLMFAHAGVLTAVTATACRLERTGRSLSPGRGFLARGFVIALDEDCANVRPQSTCFMHPMVVMAAPLSPNCF